MSTFQKKYDVIIMGSGPAGCSAAVYASRSLLKVGLILGNQTGGQLTTTTTVENFLGFKTISGIEMTDRFINHAKYCGAEIISDVIISVSLEKRPFILTGNSGDYTTSSIIVATGSKTRWLGVEMEEELKNNGISSCAVCDGFLFRNQEVIVIGGGNTALENALYLSNICSKITIVHRREEFRGEPLLQKKIYNTNNVSLCMGYRVIAFCGSKEKGLTETKIQGNLSSNEKERKTLKSSGAFISIGHDPCTELFEDSLELDDNKYIKVKKNSSHTSVPGIFAAGDVADPVYRQAITSAGSGCIAALNCYSFLKG